MKFTPTQLPGCIRITPHTRKDERGSFTKIYYSEAFREQGLETAFQEEYFTISYRNVLRGLHFQVPPAEHAKTVTCLSGRVLDVVLDIRIGSPTYGDHITLELSDSAGDMIYIPQGLAHGFYTLSEKATLLYNVTSVYSEVHDSGIRWDSAGIPWPSGSPALSPRDRSFPKLEDFRSPFTYKEPTSNE